MDPRPIDKFLMLCILTTGGWLVVSGIVMLFAQLF